MYKALLILMLVLTACSNRAVYENIQQNNRNRCIKEPPARYDECMARASKPYEEYEREREEAIEEKSQ